MITYTRICVAVQANIAGAFFGFWFFHHGFFERHKVMPYLHLVATVRCIEKHPLGLANEHKHLHISVCTSSSKTLQKLIT